VSAALGPNVSKDASSGEMGQQININRCMIGLVLVLDRGEQVQQLPKLPAINQQV